MATSQNQGRLAALLNSGKNYTIGGSTTISGAATLSSTLSVAGASTLTGMITTADDGGFLAGGASVSGLTAVVLTTSTLAVATHTVQVGKYVQVAADAQTLTLPAVVIGASFIIVNTAADGGALLTISPNGSDKFLVDIAGAAGTDDKDIINTKATQNQYDFVHLVGLSSVGWHIADIRGIWVDEA